MSIFNIFAKLSLNTSAFEAGMKRAESAGVTLGKTLSKYFTAGYLGTSMLMLGRNVMSAAEQIKNLTSQTGLSTTQVQELQRAAEDGGVAFEKLATVLDKVRKAKEAALSGDAQAVDSEAPALDAIRDQRGRLAWLAPPLRVPGRPAPSTGPTAPRSRSGGSRAGSH